MSGQDNIFERLSKILISRKETSKDNSYTGQLYKEGIERIIAKIKEESEELIEASTSDKEAIIHEAADLVFHVMVLLAFKDIDPSDILRELEKREGVSGIEEKSKR